MQRFLDTYWVLYFAAYVVAIIVLGWHYWDELTTGVNWIYLLAAIFGVAAGAASAIAIVAETGGRLVLLIPAAAKKLINLGRDEGRAEGREEGRLEGRAEWEAWLKRRYEAEANNLPFDDPPPSQRE